MSALAVAKAEAIIGLLMVLNSLLPVVVVLRSSRLRELLMYQLVASMSLSESLAGLMSLVLGLLALLGVSLPSWVCVVSIHLRAALVGSAAVSFPCISLERYITVIHGLRYHDILTDGRRRLLLSASWFFVVAIVCFGVTNQWLAPEAGSELLGEKCQHWRATTLGYRLYASAYSLTIYLVNAGINVRVGLVGLNQARQIRRMEASIGGKRDQKTQLQHRGVYAIAVLSMIYVVFVTPNALYTITQSLGLIEMQTTSKAPGLFRLFVLIADGWCLTLLCPMLRKECLKMIGYRPGRFQFPKQPMRRHHPKPKNV